MGKPATSAEEIAGHGLGCSGTAMFGRTGEAESVQEALRLSPKAPVKATDRRAAKTIEPVAKGFVCPLPPSEASVRNRNKRSVALEKSENVD